MFLGEDQDPSARREPQAVRHQQVREGQWKEERRLQEQKQAREEAGISPAQSQAQEQKPIETSEPVEDPTIMSDLSLGEVRDATDEFVDAASSWTLQEAARGIVWHEILSGPRSMKGKKYGWRR